MLGYGWIIGVRVPAGAGNFSLHHRVQIGSDAHPLPIQWVLGVLSLGVKRPGREADHLSPPSAEVEECVEPYLHSPNTSSWRGAQLRKVQDNFTFTFLPLTISSYFEVFWVVTPCSVVAGLLSEPLVSCHSTTWRYSSENLDLKHRRFKSSIKGK
jgi:hypothetical protein